MRMRFLILNSGCFLLCMASALCQTVPKSSLSSGTLTAEQMSIYKEFFSDYSKDSKPILNISQTTSTFEADDGDLGGCMKTFTKSNSRAATVHSFAEGAFADERVRLVDPKTHTISDPGEAIAQGQSVDDAVEAGFARGLLTLSEIVFDGSHTHAAFNYSFHCGRLCGHGATVVFQLRGGKWRRSKAYCGSWIN